jgi:pilus assembly protein CpaE
MKIALISRNSAHVKTTCKALEAASHAVVFTNGTPAQMRATAEQERPDLMLVESDFTEPGELAQVEYVTSSFPLTTVALLCARQSPEFLIGAMRAGVREVLLSPPEPGALDALISRIAAKKAVPHAVAQGKILAFMSCKGGSGATFLATNLGYQLAESSRVLLIDLNLQFGDALSFVYDGVPASTLADVAKDIRRLDASFLAASCVRIEDRYSILAAPEDPARSMEVKPEHIDAILNLAVTQYDFVLLDLGRSIDPLSIKALDHAYRIFPVLQAELPYLRNARKLLDSFKALGYQDEKVELIVNRFSPRSAISMDDIERSLGCQHLHTVPNSYKDVSASINHGHPLIKTARSNAVSRILTEMAHTLAPRPRAVSGMLGRLFGRA